MYKKGSQQHPEFPCGLPSKYYLGPMLLNFSDWTRTGVFNMEWQKIQVKTHFASQQTNPNYYRGLHKELFSGQR